MMERKHIGSVLYLYGAGGVHGELMLVMKILGIFRCICPVAEGGKLESDIGETTSQLQLTVTKKESRLMIALPSDFSKESRDTDFLKNILRNN